MRLQDPEGFSIQDPTAKKVCQVPLAVLGPHYEWSGDRHDKLASIDFPIWVMRDMWPGKWLDIWVLPNNWLKAAIAYLEELGGELVLSLCLCIGIHLHTIGMPVQSTTECGSETTELYGVATALW